LLLLAAVLLVGLGAWTYYAVERSLREIRANTLGTELEAEVRALRASVNSQASLEALREIAIGERGELFAVDRNGTLLSESRLAPGQKNSVLRSHLAEGVAASASAADAAGRRGAVLEPYLNHRGEEVIGAWRWIPEKQIAIAVEMPEAQA